MSAGVKEYWIVNPFNQDLNAYLFEGNNISKNISYKNRQAVISYSFPGLEANLERIFTQ